MKRLLQIGLPFVLLALFAWIIYSILASKEEPRKRVFAEAVSTVQVRPVTAQDYRITLRSQGTVQARTQSSLIPEVRGRIVSVSPNFQEGAFFREGEVLVEIDDRDYRTDLIVAEAALARAELNLEEERARSEQAKRDWERLNPGREAKALTLRQPQLREAESAVASAAARLEGAKVNLERTKVTASFDGRVLSKRVDVGQFVSPGNVMAQLYAVDIAEVRLPLTASRFGYLELPDAYRDEGGVAEDGPAVKLSSELGGKRHVWEGTIVRSEGSVDTSTRQLFVVAHVEDPYGRTVPGRPPLKVGTFVQAEIDGLLLKDVFPVPRKLYRENKYVLVVTPEGKLQRREVSLAWETDDAVIVSEGLEEGDLLCLTSVTYALQDLAVDPVLEDGSPAVSGLREKRRDERAKKTRETAAKILEKHGAEMPPELRTKLEEALAAKKGKAMRPAMTDVREWAKENGVELPR